MTCAELACSEPVELPNLFRPSHAGQKKFTTAGAREREFGRRYSERVIESPLIIILKRLVEPLIDVNER